MTLLRGRVLLLVLASVSLTACGSDGAAGDDAPDAGAPDAGAPDAGAPDAGAPDAGAPDAGHPETGHPDAGAAGAADSGAPDAGPPDAGAPDAGDGDPGDGGATPLCGNGAIDEGEQCDGANLGGLSCATFGWGGALTCDPSCRFDLDSCVNLEL